MISLMYVDCYATRVWHTIVVIRKKISAILNRVSMKQGSEFCVYRHNQIIHMSPDGWGYVQRCLLKLGVNQLEDYVTKRGIGDVRGHDLSYHSLRETSEWIHFCLHTFFFFSGSNIVFRHVKNYWALEAVF